ncbi:hypothetical protein PM082_018692 [Marasmius tenuissimus]|nr:hypothetical protein PM082_018692 [Marasmius tenuissimus]
MVQARLCAPLLSHYHSALPIHQAVVRVGSHIANAHENLPVLPTVPFATQDYSSFALSSYGDFVRATTVESVTGYHLIVRKKLPKERLCPYETRFHALEYTAPHETRNTQLQRLQQISWNTGHDHLIQSLLAFSRFRSVLTPAPPSVPLPRFVKVVAQT